MPAGVHCYSLSMERPPSTGITAPVAKANWPETRGTALQITTAPSVKLTVLAGDAPVTIGVTVAVKVTDSVRFDGLREETTVVTGLQYTFLRQVPVAHAGWGLRAEAMDVSASTSFQDSSSLSWAQPLRSHWLELPLGLAYRLGQRGSLAAGLQLSRAIGLRIPLDWQLTDYQLSPAMLTNIQTGTNAMEWFGSSASTKVVSTSEVRAWQLGGWLRYDYSLSRQLALSASLRYGNGQWVDTRPQPLSTVYLGLGLCYRFR